MSSPPRPQPVAPDEDDDAPNEQENYVHKNLEERSVLMRLCLIAIVAFFFLVGTLRSSSDDMHGIAIKENRERNIPSDDTDGILSDGENRGDGGDDGDEFEMIGLPNQEEAESDDGDSQIYGRPFVILNDGGCSGSTAFGRCLRSILAGHGLDGLEDVGFEFLNVHKKRKPGKEYRNRFYHELVEEILESKLKGIGDLEEEDLDIARQRIFEDMHEQLVVKSIKIAQRKGRDEHKLVFFKANVDQFYAYRNSLEELGATFAGVYRHNILDRCTCMIKDCFWNVVEFGYPVFARNGTRTDLCFDRRRRKDVPVQAYFTNVTGCLDMASVVVTKIENQSTKSSRSDFPSASSEELFEFETSISEDALQRSIDVWVKILRPYLGKALDERKVREAFVPDIGTRRTSSSQRDSIYDYSEVEMELKQTDLYSSYLRKDAV